MGPRYLYRQILFIGWPALSLWLRAVIYPRWTDLLSAFLPVVGEDPKSFSLDPHPAELKNRYMNRSWSTVKQNILVLLDVKKTIVFKDNFSVLKNCTGNFAYKLNFVDSGLYICPRWKSYNIYVVTSCIRNRIWQANITGSKSSPLCSYHKDWTNFARCTLPYLPVLLMDVLSESEVSTNLFSCIR